MICTNQAVEFTLSLLGTGRCFFRVPFNGLYVAIADALN